MINRLIFVTISSLFTLSAMAQQANSHLTLISEHNEPFIAYVNGIVYNQTPKIGIRIEHINKTALPIKLVFPQKRNATIMHPNLPVTDLEGYSQDITYTVNANKRGDNAFMVYAVIPMEPLNIDEKQIEVFDANGRTIRQQYDNLNRKWTNPQTVYRGGNRKASQLEERYEHTSAKAMNIVDFEQALKTIKKSSMDKNKIQTAKTIINSNLMTTSQIISILKLFSFDDNKLEFSKYAYNSCVDKNNYFMVLDVFSFSSNREALNKFITTKL